MNTNRTIIATFAFLLTSTAIVAQTTQLQVATISAGAAALDNGSVITIGQPFVGRFAAQDGSVTVSSGLLPVLLAPPDPWPVPIKPSRVVDGRFYFSFSAPPGRNFVIEASTNLSTWSPVWTNLSTWTGFVFEDVEAGIFPQRFFRVLTP